MHSRQEFGYSKELFFENSSQNYFNVISKKMNAEVNQMSDEEILSCNIQEWADYLTNKYYISPILIYETNIEKSLSKIKIKMPNHFYNLPYEKDYFETDGIRVTFKIPFDGAQICLTLDRTGILL